MDYQIYNQADGFITTVFVQFICQYTLLKVTKMGTTIQYRITVLNTVQWIVRIAAVQTCFWYVLFLHYNDVIMSAMASEITSRTIVHSTVYSSADQRKHQSSASPAFVREIHRWPVNSPHKRPVTRKMFPFDDVIISNWIPKTWHEAQQTRSWNRGSSQSYAVLMH